MVDSSSPSGLSAENEAFLKNELLPTVEALTKRFVDKASAVALSQGWRPEHAEAAAGLGVAPFLERLFKGEDPQEAVDQGIALGKKQALGEMFKTELEEGHDRHAAFRAVLSLQEDNARRLGEAPADVPEEWIAAALVEVDAAATDNQPLEDQVSAGLVTIAACALRAMEADLSSVQTR